jgi:gluconokinase
MILILMGVSGIGKTTIGSLLSARIGWKFEDADDYHSQENRQKMAAAIPLTDADRGPWLTALNQRMMQYQAKGENAILACSALRQQYRELLTSGFAKDEIRFVYLYAPAALVQDRMRLRNHPYMNPDLLGSQLATLEESSDAWPVSVTGSPEQSIEEILTRLQEAGVLTAAVERE